MDVVEDAEVNTHTIFELSVPTGGFSGRCSSSKPTDSDWILR
jgi:hypothetical protein